MSCIFMSVIFMSVIFSAPASSGSFAVSHNTHIRYIKTDDRQADKHRQHRAISPTVNMVGSAKNVIMADELILSQ